MDDVKFKDGEAVEPDMLTVEDEDNPNVLVDIVVDDDSAEVVTGDSFRASAFIISAA